MTRFRFTPPTEEVEPDLVDLFNGSEDEYFVVDEFESEECQMLRSVEVDNFLRCHKCNTFSVYRRKGPYGFYTVCINKDHKKEG